MMHQYTNLKKVVLTHRDRQPISLLFDGIPSPDQLIEAVVKTPFNSFPGSKRVLNDDGKIVVVNPVKDDMVELCKQWDGQRGHVSDKGVMLLSISITDAKPIIVHPGGTTETSHACPVCPICAPSVVKC